MVSLSSSLQFVSDANLAVLNNSAASSSVTASSAQLGDDTFTPSGQNAQSVKSGSATRFDLDSSVAEPFYASNVQIQGSIEKSGSNTYATLEVSGETTSVSYITSVSNGLDGSTTTIYPFQTSSSAFNLSITASESGSSYQVDASLTTSDTENYLGTIQQEDAAIIANFSVSNGTLVHEATSANQPTVGS